nr:glycoside hydrolase family 3 protein [Actinomyces sp. 432]
MADAFAVGRQGWGESIDGGLGHLTRIYGTDPVSVADGTAKLARLQREVVSRNAFGIPAIAHEECLTGFTALGATVYPAAIAWGATWRPALVEQMARRIGADLHAVGVHQGLAPLLDVVRDYRWGRVEETCGEDPYLVGTLGTAYVRGLQAQGVHATLKHFVAYPASKAGRNHAPVSMGTRELEDIMLPPFEMAVREGGVASVMNSYSDIDGEPVAASRHLLTQVLRERWGFTGTVVSDYWSVRFLQAMHHVAGDYAHAAALAVRAGLDVELPETTCYSHLEAALDASLLTETELDTAVARVLTQKAELGLLDADWDPTTGVEADRDLDSPGNRAVARAMAEESVILLKNDGVLPLNPDASVAVSGPVWEDVRSFLGCYSFPNHVLSRDGGRTTGLDIRDLPTALGAAHPGEAAFHQGVGFIDGRTEDFDAAVAAAAAADVAIVALGDIAGLFGGGPPGRAATSSTWACPDARASCWRRCWLPAPPPCWCWSPGAPTRWGSTPIAAPPSCRPSCLAWRAPTPLSACSPVPSTPPGGCPSPFRMAVAASRAPTWRHHSPGTPTASPTWTPPRCTPSATGSATRPSRSPAPPSPPPRWTPTARSTTRSRSPIPPTAPGPKSSSCTYPTRWPRWCAR